MPFDNQMPGARAPAPAPAVPGTGGGTEIVTVERRCIPCGRRGRFRQRWPLKPPPGFGETGPPCLDCGGRTVSWPLG